MPTFRTNGPPPQAIPEGCYVAKVIAAEERISEQGNEMIVMKLQLQAGATLLCILTFVEKARTAINAFCDSTGLICPPGKDLDVNLAAADCFGRYLYITVHNEDDGRGGDPYPKIVRFLTRESALVKSPELARIKLHDLPPRHLQAV